MLNRRQFLTTTATVLLAATGITNGCTRSLTPAAPAPPPAPAVTSPEETGPRPFRVALLSDPHTVAAGSALVGAINAKLSRALADMRPLRPDLWIVNGDISDTGRTDELDAFKAIMATVARPDQYLVTTGNHDFYDRDASDEEELRHFREAFGLKTPYSSRLAGGYHWVMLADERYKTAPRYREWAWLNPEQLRWFEQVLAEHRDRPTAVFLHQPLQDTVVWSHGGNDFAGCGQVKELRAILKQNPQVKLWFSGHTHMGAEVPGNAVTREGITYVGLGSTFYLFVQAEGPEGAEYGGFRKDLSASQSRLIEIWPDRVEIKARDHVAQAWMAPQPLVLTRA